MQNLTEKIDELFAQNKGKEAEALLETCLREALQQGNLQEAVPILNELIGYCRETSQVERSYEYADRVLELMEKMQLQGTIPYATTLLNIANAYRAGGRLEDSLAAYTQVEEIYREKLKEDDMLVASLYNNKSLLYQEMGSFLQAQEALKKALAIVEGKSDTIFEVAVTYANLANTAVNLRQEREAEEYFTKAIRLFEENGIQDTHYCAALSAAATHHYNRGEYEEAEQYFLRAMKGIEQHLGQNEFYHRMKENAQVCRAAAQSKQEKNSNGFNGLELSRNYYETFGRPMLESSFGQYLDQIAVGLAGEGSDCFGFDDGISRDHDWGPGFCLWVSEETYDQIGDALEEAYEALPKEFMGYTFRESTQGKGRRGVHTISGFYKNILGEDNFRLDDKGMQIAWEGIEDWSLAAAVNGEVFTDPEGVFSRVRDALVKEYPIKLRYLKIAQAAAGFCQNGQYNVPRMLQRGDRASAALLAGEAVKEALKLLYYVEEKYPPHDKWLFHGIKRSGSYEEICSLLERALLEPTNTPALLDTIAEKLVSLLYQKNYISDMEPYLDKHAGELLFKAAIVQLNVEELSERIAALEFKAFDKVKNLGGRADCQDDWFTFSIMRKSQYLTWNRTMLEQYYYDFCREYERGHNLIEEKYGRMMESTAPGEYATMKHHFPVISEEKKCIIEEIVGIQVKWMEEFAAGYPYLAGNARSIHTSEDTPWNTSYETYLRGEISTYSDKMLQLYGRYIIAHAKDGDNIAEMIMEQSVRMYGYENLEEAEEGLRRERE